MTKEGTVLISKLTTASKSSNVLAFVCVLSSWLFFICSFVSDTPNGD